MQETVQRFVHYTFAFTCDEAGKKQIGLHKLKLTLWIHVSFMSLSDKCSPLFCYRFDGDLSKRSIRQDSQCNSKRDTNRQAATSRAKWWRPKSFMQHIFHSFGGVCEVTTYGYIAVV